jgi:exopolysaccharide biosynthesis polyprenyl glycosylphosphotransferase
MVHPLSRDANRRLLEWWALLLLLGDIALLAAALLTSFWIKFTADLIPFGVKVDSPITLSEYSGHLAFGAATFLILLFFSGVHEKFFITHFRTSTLAVFRASVIWAVLYLGLSLSLHINPPLSRLFVFLSGILLPVYLLLWRLILYQLFLFVGHRALLRQRILLLGWSDEARRLCQELSRSPDSPFAVVACGMPSPNASLPPSLPHLPSEASIREWIDSRSGEILLVANLHLDPRLLIELANRCERNYIEFKLIPSYFQILLSGLRSEIIAGIPILGISELPLDHALNRILKRMVDIAGAVVGLIGSFPLIVICAILLSIESPGPIFYRQCRIGRSGRPFHMYKIRSMRLDAESSGAGWTIADDPRCLNIGAFMRRWNIDETPQFWNVLMGQMSLVGPRPERPEFTVSFEDSIPHYNARHSCKPGMTGWAQIHGLRGDTDVGKRIQYDLYYVENWSVFLDFFIIMRTLV